MAISCSPPSPGRSMRGWVPHWAGPPTRDRRWPARLSRWVWGVTSAAGERRDRYLRRVPASRARPDPARSAPGAPAAHHLTHGLDRYGEKLVHPQLRGLAQPVALRWGHREPQQGASRRTLVSWHRVPLGWACSQRPGPVAMYQCNAPTARCGASWAIKSDIELSQPCCLLSVPT